MTTWYGYRRPDGSVGSRNFVAVIPAVTCANDVANAICREVQGGGQAENDEPDQKQDRSDADAGCRKEPRALRL